MPCLIKSAAVDHNVAHVDNLHAATSSAQHLIVGEVAVLDGDPPTCTVTAGQMIVGGSTSGMRCCMIVHANRLKLLGRVGSVATGGKAAESYFVLWGSPGCSCHAEALSPVTGQP